MENSKTVAATRRQRQRHANLMAWSKQVDDNKSKQSEDSDANSDKTTKSLLRQPSDGLINPLKSSEHRTAEDIREETVVVMAENHYTPSYVAQDSDLSTSGAHVHRDEAHRAELGEFEHSTPKEKEENMKSRGSGSTMSETLSTESQATRIRRFPWWYVAICFGISILVGSTVMLAVFGGDSSDAQDDQDAAGIKEGLNITHDGTYATEGSTTP